MDHGKPLPWIALAGALALAACTGVVDEGGSSSQAVAAQGRWRLPSDVAAVGADVDVEYDGAPRWTGTRGCSGRLREGARRLGNHLLQQRFDNEITSIGGYACRRNTASSGQMSVHGTGRALDIFIPTVAGKADNTRGDKVAHWLIENSEKIGVQLIIWDRTIWRADGTNDASYGGPHPHDDHLHIELNVEAAAAQTPWFINGEDGMPVSGEPTEPTEPAADGGAAPTADAGADAAPSPTEPTEPSEPTADAGAPVTPEPAVDTPAPEDDGTSHEETSEEEEGPGEVDSLGVGNGNDGESRRGQGSWSGVVDDEPKAGCAVAPSRSGGTSPTAPLGGIGLGFAVLAWVRRRR